MTGPVAGEPRIIRSGVSRLFIWMGIALAGAGVIGGLVGVVAAVLTDDHELLPASLIFALVFGTGGGLMHVAGRRARVELARDHIRWTSVLGSPTSIPWPAVYRVEVPLSPWEGRTVRLLLRDGRRVQVAAIRMSSGDGGAWADRGYRSAGRQIVRAHQEWLRWNRPPH